MRLDFHPLLSHRHAHRRTSAGRLLPILGLASAIGLYCGVEPTRQLATQEVTPVAATLGKSAPSSAAIPAALRLVLLNKAQQDAGPQYALRAEPVGNQKPLVARSEQTGVWAHLDSQGVQVGSLHTPGSPLLSLALSGYGCEGALRKAESVTPRTAAGSNRAEYARLGMTEWYVNSALGIEQGFTIDKEPGCGGAQKLALEMEIRSTAPVALVGEGASARLEVSDGPGGQPLRYGDLFAVDADGKELPTRMLLKDRTVRLEVDAAGARYPVTVDPTWTQQAILVDTTTGTASDQFGFSVAVSGDTAVVGAYVKKVGANDGQGQAYVFVRSGTTWTQQAILADATTGAPNDTFGSSVALSGDTAVVGARNKKVGANSSQGQAYVFVRSGTTWTQQAFLVDATTGAVGDAFGSSVALSGDTAVVGASSKTVGANVNQGQAYVFVRSGTTWTRQDILVDVTTGAFGDRFGFSVALSGDTAVVGAYDKKVGANGSQGQAYVFVRSGATWTQQAFLVDATTGAVSDQFGFSVALSGDTAVVSARHKKIGANSNQGQAYVFVRSGTTWTQQAILVDATTGAAFDRFGFSVALSGDTAVVGAVDKNVGANSSQGQAYVFRRSGTTWTQQDILVDTTTGAAFDSFGSSVAVSGFTAVVGAPFKTVGANNSQGQAYVFITTKPNGSPCAAGTECDSAFCTDGVCCDMACGGTDSSDCRSCLGAQNGMSNGQCGRIQAVANFTCRASANGKACDQAEVCNGSSDSCPTDAFKSAGVECRAAVMGGDGSTCDVAETCAGGTPDCPADGHKTSGTECRAAVTGGDGSTCDVAETCSGSTVGCPANALKGSGAVCRPATTAADGTSCDVQETCSGSTATCPADAIKGNGTSCRPAVTAGDGTSCDVAESCSGGSNACPANAFKALDTVCRGAAGACDAVEKCQGTAACPSNGFEPNTKVCRGALGPCDEQEMCTGSMAACPGDALKGAGALCKPPGANQTCDPADFCDGTRISCPAKFAKAGTTGLQCVAPKKCNGVGSCL